MRSTDCASSYLYSRYWTLKNIVTFKFRLGVTYLANLCTICTSLKSTDRGYDGPGGTTDRGRTGGTTDQGVRRTRRYDRPGSTYSFAADIVCVYFSFTSTRRARKNDKVMRYGLSRSSKSVPIESPYATSYYIDYSIVKICLSSIVSKT